MSKILVAAVAGAVAGINGFGLTKNIPAPGMRRLLALALTVGLMTLARAALSEEHSVFVGRWDGTLSESGTCVGDGKTATPPSEARAGYVVIEDAGDDSLLLLTKGFPQGIRFTIRRTEKGIYVDARPDQSAPWTPPAEGPRMANVSGTTTIKSGSLAVRQGTLSVTLVETTNIVKEKMLLPNEVADCTFTFKYVMQRPFAEPEDAAAAPPPAGSKIVKGTSWQDVFSLLGQPQSKKTQGDAMLSTYSDGTVVLYPGGTCEIEFWSGFVNFTSGCNPLFVAKVSGARMIVNY